MENIQDSKNNDVKESKDSTQQARIRWRRWKHAAVAVSAGVTFTYFFCEYLIYYIVQSQCDWPELRSPSEKEPVRVMILADTHLLGSRTGHWFDKMRREWQMHRAFQTAMTLHQPEIVFLLGDVFDEGKWCSEQEFDDYVERFHRLFSVSDRTKMYVVAGNHDMGFHYSISPHLAGRFKRRMSSPVVQMVSVRGNHFVLLNSMAMEGDGCFLCAHARKEIDRIANLLKCTRGSSVCKGEEKLSDDSRPILMQHFPLYRVSDVVCEDADAPPPDRTRSFEELWDCLSRESTDYLAESLRPRAVFGGHTHHACRLRHAVGSEGFRVHFVEYSVPSFSWRNRVSPEYVLATFSLGEYKTSRCTMPEENTLMAAAAILLLALAAYLRCVACRAYPVRRSLFK